MTWTRRFSPEKGSVGFCLTSQADSCTMQGKSVPALEHLIDRLEDRGRARQAGALLNDRRTTGRFWSQRGHRPEWAGAPCSAILQSERGRYAGSASVQNVSVRP